MSNRTGPSRGRQVVLIVLDGWGYSPNRDGNAIALSRTPVWDRLWTDHPRTLLQASGRAVGLPEGQMGNSEVGHLTLGAGREVPQDLVRISDSIASGAFFALPPLVELCNTLREDNGTLHLVGLLGPGGVHAIDTHLLACVELAVRQRVGRIAVHGFLDGRDTPPTSAADVVATLEADLDRIGQGRAAIATLTGRYYGMDRDRRWDRTALAYRALIRGEGIRATHPVEAIRGAYAEAQTDEFIMPRVLTENGQPVSIMKDGDGVLCFNYRSDRMRQIVRALAVEGFREFDVSDRPTMALVTMTEYDQTFTFPRAFPPITLSRIVAQVLSAHERPQFHTAETEKYPHVTYFFNGGHEPPYPGEERCLIPSPRVATYDLAPAMSAPGVTDALCAAIEARDHDFILCNYANPDMVGHTGVLPAVVEAVETVDACLGQGLRSAERANARVIITADHGNCEQMIDHSGGPHTAHTTNPVPLVMVRGDATDLRSGGSLKDVGPTVLHLLGITPPPDMTGHDLRDLTTTCAS